MTVTADFDRVRGERPGTDLDLEPSHGQLEAALAEAAPAALGARANNKETEKAAAALLTFLHDLPAGSPDRERVRTRVIELHLPLAEYLARRFRNRGEQYDDLVQVA